MPQAEYTTTIDLDDELDVEVVVTYSWSRYIPAVREGPMAGPAEDGATELLSAKRVDSGVDILDSLDADDIDRLLSRISEEDPEADEEAARADYLYDLRRDEQMMENYYD